MAKLDYGYEEDDGNIDCRDVLCKPADKGDTENDCEVSTSIESNEIQWMPFFFFQIPPPM